MSDSDAEFEKFLQEVSHHKLLVRPSDTPGERLASVFPESVYFQTLDTFSHTHPYTVSQSLSSSGASYLSHLSKDSSAGE